VSAANPFGGTATVGDVRKATVVLENLGDTVARGPATVSYYASTTGALDDSALFLGSSTVALSLAAGKSVSVPVSLKVPNPPADGTFHLLAVVTAAGSRVDSGGGNNTAEAAGTVAVARQPTVFPEGYGDVITFTRTLLLGLQEIGTFTTDTGVSGSYVIFQTNNIASPSSISLSFPGTG
jgi:hypothetical protein